MHTAALLFYYIWHFDYNMLPTLKKLYFYPFLFLFIFWYLVIPCTFIVWLICRVNVKKYSEIPIKLALCSSDSMWPKRSPRALNRSYRRHISYFWVLFETPNPLNRRTTRWITHGLYYKIIGPLSKATYSHNTWTTIFVIFEWI